MPKQFTPGPWQYEIGEGLNNLRVITQHPDWYSRQICRLGFIQHLTMTEANARLIAAAPDLLAALNTIVKYVNGGYPGDMLRDIEFVAQTAIAKAEDD